MTDNRFILSRNEKEIDTEIALRTIDDKDLIHLAISYGLETVKVEGGNNAIWAYFKASDFDPFESQYVGERNIPLSVRMLAQSVDWWRNLMVTWKSKKRYLDKVETGHNNPHGRFHVWTNPGKVVPEGQFTRDLDRQDYVTLIHAFGIEPVFCEGDDKYIWVHFLNEDLEKFENLYFSNLEITLPLGKIMRASEWWGDMMSMWKSRSKNNGN